MPRNGSGTYSLPQAPFVAGSVISSAAVNSDLSDIGSALTGSLPRDGQAGMTGQLKAVDGSVISPALSFNNEQGTGFYLPTAGKLGVVIQGVQIGFFNASGFTGVVQGATPIGAIMDFAGPAAPSQWLLCFGQAVSRITYALLFAIIGTTYGSGDGVTTFNVPDLRGTILAGKDDMGGVASGRLTTVFFGSDPTILGDRGGSQSLALTLAQLPTGIASGGTISGNGTVNTPTAIDLLTKTGPGTSVGFAGGADNYNRTNSFAPVITVTGSSAVTSNNTGGVAHPLIQPSMIVNKIIYAGA